jgi:cobalt/nickel transport protein
MLKSKMARTNVILLVLVVIITVMSLYLARGAEFGGADGKAQGLITEINPEYKPWSRAWFKPPSTEIESLLFAFQASIGAGFIGYYIGVKRSKNHKEE